MNTRLLHPGLLATVAATTILSFAGIAHAGHGIAPGTYSDKSTSTSQPTRSGSSSWVYKVLASNDLGVHCVDADFSVFSILPPYNVVIAQVVRRSGTGRPVVVNDSIVTLRYEAVRDATGAAAASDPTVTWSVRTDLEIQSRENVLLLHDHNNGTGLFASKPVLCASCHYSPALDLAGAGPNGTQSSHELMSAVMHDFHADKFHSASAAARRLTTPAPDGARYRGTLCGRLIEKGPGDGAFTFTSAAAQEQSLRGVLLRRLLCQTAVPSFRQYVFPLDGSRRLVVVNRCGRCGTKTRRTAFSRSPSGRAGAKSGSPAIALAPDPTTGISRGEHHVIQGKTFSCNRRP